MLPTDVDGAGLDAPLGVAWKLRKKLDVLGHQIKASVAELFDPPVVNEGVEGRLEVAQPQQPRTDLKVTVFVVEAMAEGGHQAVGSEGCPAHSKHREEDEDGGKGTRLEAHVYIDLKGTLQAEQTQFTGLAQTHAVTATVNADGIVSDGV